MRFTRVSVVQTCTTGHIFGESGQISRQQAPGNDDYHASIIALKKLKLTCKPGYYNVFLYWVGVMEVAFLNAV